MTRIKSHGTKPEKTVRDILKEIGWRPRSCLRKLPGKPDFTFVGLRKVIFVHGCFWHLHAGCSHYRLPLTRVQFWLPKLEGNRSRDRKIIRSLRSQGWDVLVVWECECKTKSRAKLLKKCKDFIDNKNAQH